MRTIRLTSGQDPSPAKHSGDDIGQVDALLDDPFVAAAVLRRKGLDERITQHPLQIHSGEVSLMYSQAGVDEAVLKRLDRALLQRKTDGTLGKLIAKYQG